MILRRSVAWIDARLPVSVFWQKHFRQYLVPKNLDFWYFFGVMAGLGLVIVVISGVFLAVHYKPSVIANSAGVPLAYASSEFILHHVSWGWLLRKVHALGASALFLVLLLHIIRGLLYGSYRKPRELAWLFGMALWLLCLAEAFFGRLLPWGQEGYWGTTVILNLFSAIPLIGQELALWFRGGASVGDATLGRFFVLHAIVLPFLMLLMFALHLVSVRLIGTGNPDGVEIDRIARPEKFLPYHPYFTVRDLLALVAFLFVFFAVVFFTSDAVSYWLGVSQSMPADPLTTPEHVRPVWYFAPYFAMMRTVIWNLFGIDARFWGGLIMSLAIFVPMLLPWLDCSPVRSIRYRGVFSRVLLGALGLAFLGLTVLGSLPSSAKVEMLVRICTFYYFAFFILMPVWSRLDRSLQPPESCVMT